MMFLSLGDTCLRCLHCLHCLRWDIMIVTDWFGDTWMTCSRKLTSSKRSNLSGLYHAINRLFFSGGDVYISARYGWSCFVRLRCEVRGQEYQKGVSLRCTKRRFYIEYTLTSSALAVCKPSRVPWNRPASSAHPRQCLHLPISGQPVRLRHRQLPLQRTRRVKLCLQRR